MKQLLTLVFVCVFSASVYAECNGTGLSIFPNGNTVKRNSIFILDGYAESQNIILGLNKKYKIYLKSGSTKINLIVTETLFGQFYLTQALLKPETLLEAGLEYRVIIDSLPDYENLYRYNRTTYKPEVVSYRVIDELDFEKPILFGKPKEIGKTLVHYGCGPSIHVVFSNTSLDTADIIIKTTLKNLMTGKETTYFIEPNKDKIKIGHGMCSGAFDFDESENYEIEFSFMDASGNVTNWTDKRIQFTKPNKETNYSDE